MHKTRIEAGLVGTATRAQARHDLWQWLQDGTNPARGLPEDTLVTAHCTGFRVLSAFARTAARPNRWLFDNRRSMIAAFAAGLTVKLETSIYNFDSRHIPTATSQDERPTAFVIDETAARHHEAVALNPHAAALLTEASRALPCDDQLQDYSARVALTTLAIMDRYWDARANRMADEIWLTGQYEGAIDG